MILGKHLVYYYEFLFLLLGIRVDFFNTRNAAAHTYPNSIIEAQLLPVSRPHFPSEIQQRRRNLADFLALGSQLG